ncbi:hypothetical protein HFO33_34330 [Rhizobium leguminosarum]|nr:TniQ family protein [Rhizobium leguminosarum]MBY5667370.1 hypothetical protein [Rhizobium leguminosarum]MBY5710124.1 hypothetical protein [Rhizobium leguminosarum]MBY5721576.1 hypothetical protein [Rhizobium leguminosarum]
MKPSTPVVHLLSLRTKEHERRVSNLRRVSFPIGHSEPLIHFASRYARSRGVRLYSFMQHMQLPLGNSAKYEQSSAILSRLTGNDPRALQRHAIVRKTSTSTLFDQTLTVRHMMRDRPRFCPRCVEIDLENGSGRVSNRPIFRAPWMVKHIRACAEHDVELVTMSNGYDAYHCPDFSNALNDRWATVMKHVGSQEKRDASEFDRYFTARLSADDFSHEILDALTYSDAIGFCQKIGSLKPGKTTKNRDGKLLPDEADNACRTGFDLIVTGFSGLRACLERAAEQRSSLSTGFGTLLHHIAVNTDRPGFEPIADLAREVAFTKTTARRVLAVSRSDSFTVRTAADAFDIGPVTAKKIFDPSIQRNGPVIDTSLAEEFALTWHDRISRTQASKYLQVNVEVLDDIEEAGFLARHTLGSLERRFFRKTEIRSFLTRLAERSGHDPSDKDMVPLLAKRVRFSRILGDILSGTVRAGITSTVDDFNLPDLLVHREDLRPYECIKPDGTQTIGYVQMKLRLSADLLRHLREQNVIESVTIKDSKGKERLLFIDESIERFKKQFVSVKYITRHKADLPRTEKRLLGIAPVYDFGGVNRIYRREDISK